MTVGDIKIGLNNMINFVVYCSNEEIFIDRTVVTLVDILSIVGGFASLIISAAKLIAKIYSPIQFNEELLKDLYLI